MKIGLQKAISTRKNLGGNDYINLIATIIRGVTMIISCKTDIKNCVKLDSYTNELCMKFIMILLIIWSFLIVVPTLNYAENYTYDTAGRLTSVTYDDGSSITYTYDAAGNIITKAVGNDTTDPFDTPDSTLILTNENSSVTILSSATSILYGSDGDNYITIEAGGKVKLLNFLGNNEVTIEADSHIFTIFRSGATITFEGTDGTILKIPATLEAQTLHFDNGSWVLIIDSGKVMFGDQVVKVERTPIAVSN